MIKSFAVLVAFVLMLSAPSFADWHEIGGLGDAKIFCMASVAGLQSNSLFVATSNGIYSSDSWGSGWRHFAKLPYFVRTVVQMSVVGGYLMLLGDDGKIYKLKWYHDPNSPE